MGRYPTVWNEAIHTKPLKSILLGHAIKSVWPTPWCKDPQGQGWKIKAVRIRAFQTRGVRPLWEKLVEWNTTLRKGYQDPVQIRFGHGMDNMGSSIFATPQPVQKSFCSPDSLQRQVVVNNMWQQARGGQQNYSLQQANANNRSTLQQSYRGTSSNQQATPQNYSTPSQPRSSSPNSRMMWHSEKSTSNTQRQQSYSSYRSDNGYFTRDAHFQDHNSEQYYRGNREPELQHDQSSQHNRRWEYDYRREHSRSNRRRNW
ncbi:RNA-binding protein 7-like isoform X3 [Stegostoma tigrinum]|uniref:RNA-binding protein 7-like isoform X3 n=1 Tax=Stegostoma tigrinum TaxID=3053191 RepID=UPI00202B9C4F|nr:RNA-binding protein 7-like isoform X3 [Stegostoma tigrinum]